jgi:putative heme transporter
MEFSLKLVFTPGRNYWPDATFARPLATFGAVATRAPTRIARAVLLGTVGVALAAAVWFQRTTISSALGELGSMPGPVIALLVALGVLERVTRADIMRRLLAPVSFGRALTIHDVGSSAAKGLPLGGPIATGLRYSISRAAVPPHRFWSALVAYGVVTTFVTWLLPFAVLVIDVSGRTPSGTDLVMLGVCVAVVGGSAVFWAFVLRSDRVTARIVTAIHRVHAVAVRRVPASTGRDPVGGFLEVRRSLQETARRPTGLLVRTAIAQATGAVILLVALRGLGVGGELGTVEFARVYFVVTLLSSFVPVPGGVGVVEAGLTGALVAAGVAPPTALAAVLVYRLLTYVTPIVVGAVLYVAWRIGVRRRQTSVSVSLIPARSLS